MKTILITGASRGLGKCLADVFSNAGYNLILHNGRKDGDLMNPATISKLKKRAIAEDVDILINNAGVYLNKFFPDTEVHNFQEIIETNLLVPIELTKAVWPIFEKKKSGMVVFINSVAGRCGSPGELGYCTSKYGLKGFADCLQYDGMRANVRVLSVFLGAMRTDMIKGKGGDPMHNIDPVDAAQSIYELCGNYKGSEITEVTIDRIGKL